MKKIPKFGRVCFFIGTMSAGGVARNSINLATAFLSEGYEVDFYLTYNIGEFLESVPMGANVFSSNSSAKASLFYFIRYLKRYKPAVVISARDYLNVISYVGIKLSQVNCIHIATIRTSTYVERKSLSTWVTGVENWLATQVYKRTNHVVAVSESVLKEEEKNRRLKVGTIKKIYNPVVHSSIFSIETAVEKTGLNLCSVGRLTKQKDFSTLLKAMRILVNTHPTIRLDIIGDGELMTELCQERDLYGLNDTVVFRGSLPSAWQEIADAKVLVQTSLWEGLPTVLIEALALGTNVVATDCPGGAAEILENGEYGFLAQPGSPQSVAEAILEALGNPKSPYKLKHRALDFTVEKAMKRYEALFLKNKEKMS